MLESTQAMYTRMREGLKTDSHTRALLYWVLQLILTEFRLDHGRRRELTSLLPRIVQDTANEEEAAKRIWNLTIPEANRLENQLMRRGIVFLEHIRKRIRANASILDFGCGDGQIGLSLSMNDHHVFLYDVTDYLGGARLAIGKNGLEFSTNWVEVQSRRWDVGLALTVIHHCDDPKAELARLSSVANRLVIIESVLDESTMPWALQAFVDWLYNRGFHPGAEISVPGNYRSVVGWRDAFAQLGLRVVHEKDLGVDLPIVPEMHHLFVLERA